MTYDREVLTKVIADNMHWKKVMSDGYLSVGWNDPEDIADAVIAYLESTGALAKAWEEGKNLGYAYGRQDEKLGYSTKLENPYRRTE